MSDVDAIASPHAAFHIVSYLDGATGRWAYRVFGPEAAWFGNFASAHEAVAFIERSTTPAVADPSASHVVCEAPPIG